MLDASGGRDEYRKLDDAWSELHYHRPSDEWRPEYRAAWTRPELTFHFLVGLAIADAPARPTWRPGDVFAAFAKQRPRDTPPAFQYVPLEREGT